jgi:DNA-binding FrmR family transcriptional regulator
MADSDLDRIEGLTSQIKQSIDDDVRFAEVVEELDALLYLLDNASLESICLRILP